MFGFGQLFLEAVRRQDFWLLIGAILIMAAAIFSIMLHEIAHGYAAWKNGDPTAKYYGRLTLNPVKHFDLLGFACFFFVGIGWAKPVPCNPGNFRNYRKGLFWVSIAGVLTNFLLAFVTIPIWMLLWKAFQASPSDWLYILCYVLESMWSLNLVLVVFNLIPVYPLDGFHVLESAMKRGTRFKQFMYEYGKIILLILMLALYALSFFGISVISAAANWLGWPFVQFWSLLIF